MLRKTRGVYCDDSAFWIFARNGSWYGGWCGGWCGESGGCQSRENSEKSCSFHFAIIWRPNYSLKGLLFDWNGWIANLIAVRKIQRKKKAPWLYRFFDPISVHHDLIDVNILMNFLSRLVSMQSAWLLLFNLSWILNEQLIRIDAHQSSSFRHANAVILCRKMSLDKWLLTWSLDRIILFKNRYAQPMDCIFDGLYS